MTTRAAYRSLHGGLVLKVEAPRSSLTKANGTAPPPLATAWRFTVYAPWGTSETIVDALEIAAGAADIPAMAVRAIVAELYSIAAKGWPAVIEAAMKEARE